MPEHIGPVLPAGTLGERPQPVLALDELRLRPWEGADADQLVDAYADPAIQRWHGQSMPRTEALAWIEDRARRWRTEQGADWAIVDGRMLVGRMALGTLHLERGLASITYWVTPPARGRRVAPRALDAVRDWAFELGLHRLELLHVTGNAASCRVAERSGFRLEGTRLQDELLADGWHDSHLHACVRPGDRAAPPGAGEQLEAG